LVFGSKLRAIAIGRFIFAHADHCWWALVSAESCIPVWSRALHVSWDWRGGSTDLFPEAFSCITSSLISTFVAWFFASWVSDSWKWWAISIYCWLSWINSWWFSWISVWISDWWLSWISNWWLAWVSVITWWASVLAFCVIPEWTRARHASWDFSGGSTNLFPEAFSWFATNFITVVAFHFVL
jgi:hypothetical protein